MRAAPGYPDLPPDDASPAPATFLLSARYGDEADLIFFAVADSSRRTARLDPAATLCVTGAGRNRAAVFVDGTAVNGCTGLQPNLGADGFRTLPRWTPDFGTRIWIDPALIMTQADKKTALDAFPSPGKTLKFPGP